MRELHQNTVACFYKPPCIDMVEVTYRAYCGVTAAAVAIRGRRGGQRLLLQQQVKTDTM